MRVLMLLAAVAALVSLHGREYSSKAPVAGPAPPGVPSANLWVSAAGAANCSRSSIRTTLSAALKARHVCDTFDHAYHAAAPAGGDVVRVGPGTYPGATFTADASKVGMTTFMPEAPYKVTLTSPTVFGTNVRFITMKNFVVNSPRGGFLNSSHGLSTNITVAQNRINVGQKVDGTPAGIYYYSNIDTYKILNNVIGPSCCGSATARSPLGIRIGKSDVSAPYAEHVLIDGNTIQYVLRSCAYWPAEYGPCPDTTCHAPTCHNDGIQVWGIRDSTISNNRLKNDEVQGLYIEDAASSINTGLTIVNNSVSVVGGGVAFNFKGISGNWTIAYNTSRNVMVLGFGFPVAAPGTTLTLLANTAVLLMANHRGDNAGCTDGVTHVNFKYSFNVWLPHGGATVTPCSSTDVVTESPRYGGLGSSVAAFNSRNPQGTMAAVPSGAALYAIDKVRNRRVVAFHLNVDPTAPYTSRERLDLLSRNQLPTDATVKRVVGATCVIWSSARLQRLTKMRYAVATTRLHPSVARMRAEKKPRC